MKSSLHHHLHRNDKDYSTEGQEKQRQRETAGPSQLPLKRIRSPLPVEEDFSISRTSKRRRTSKEEEDRLRRKEKERRLRDKTWDEKLSYFFRDSRFFIVKSFNEENVKKSQETGVWSSLPANQRIFEEAFIRHRNVILFFSVVESGRFQGFARISSELKKNQEVNWVLPESFKKRNHEDPFKGVLFEIDWICKENLTFGQTSHLFNELNSRKPVKIARDGQEIDSVTGERLALLFPEDQNTDIIASLKKMKRQAVDKLNNSLSHYKDNYREDYLHLRHEHSLDRNPYRQKREEGRRRRGRRGLDFNDGLPRTREYYRHKDHHRVSRKSGNSKCLTLSFIYKTGKNVHNKRKTTTET